MPNAYSQIEPNTTINFKCYFQLGLLKAFYINMYFN